MAKFRRKGRVSVWIGLCRVDPKIDFLAQLCGVETYDLDDQEVNLDDKGWKSQPIAALLTPISYSMSFLDAALKAAAVRGVAEGVFAICQFDFAYDPQKAKKPLASDVVFLGHFAWNDDEDGI